MKRLTLLLLAAAPLAPAAHGQALTAEPLTAEPLNTGTLTTEILTVDVEGRPLAGVTLELVDTEPGVFGELPARRTVVTGEDGRASLPPDGILPLDLDLPADAPWALSFVHAVPHVDESAGRDLLDRPLATLPPEGEVVCVLKPLGTLDLEILGANDDDRYTVTFSDIRPEPNAHRIQRRSATFKGGRAQLPVPPGRGTLYLAREGTLGSEVQAADGRPLVVGITPRETTLLRLNVGEAERPTVVMAAFSQIPFPEVEALAPDGATVVSTFPFESSPLRLSTTVSAVAGTDPTARGIRAKHLLRAKGVPLVREASAPELFSEPGREAGAPKNSPAPLDMTFAADIGGKLRLPEVEGGWVKLAREGIIVRSGVIGTGVAPTVVRISASSAKVEGPDGGWTATARVVGPDGEPRPHVEVSFGTLEIGGATRLVTDAEGFARVTGLRQQSVSVRCVHGDAYASIASPKPGERAETAVLEASGPTRIVRGRWLGADGKPVQAGAVLSCTIDRTGIGFHGFPLAITDSDGRFSFGEIKVGEFWFEPLEGSTPFHRNDGNPLPIGPGTTPFEILVTGSENGSISVEARPSSPR